MPKQRSVNALLTTTATINDKSILLLFDEGSQVNTISPTLVHELKLPVKPLPKTHTLQFANSATLTVSHYVPCISLTLYGIYENHSRLPLYFNTGALIMESPQDMLIGIPFLRYWNIVSHFCNNTKVYTTKLGHNITIPLTCSILTQPCTSGTLQIP